MTRIIVAAWLGGVMGWLGMGALLAPVGMPVLAEQQTEHRNFAGYGDGGKLFKLSDATQPVIEKNRLVKLQPGGVV
jgi:hypothetical protein